MSPSSPAGRSRLLLASTLLYCTLAAAMGWPLLGRFGTSILNDAGDPVLNAAILAWNARTMPLTEAWWNFPIFYPADNALTFSENLLGVTLLTAPIDWITGNPLTAYNALALLSFPLAALSMWALVYYVTRVPAAALLAGLAFGFAPYRIAHLSHVQMLASFWMPLSLLGLHAFLETRRRRWLVLFGATWFLQGATNGYFLIFFSVFLAAWSAWFLLPSRRWHDLGSVALAGGAAALPLVPIFYRYVQAHERHGLSRTFGEVTAYSADVVSLLCAPGDLQVWGWVNVMCKPEGELFPGAALATVLVAGTVFRLSATTRSRPPRPARSWLRIVRTIAGAAALAYTAVAIATLIFGSMGIAYGPIRLSVSSVDKPLSVALFFTLVLAVTSAKFRDLVRRSSVFGFYAVTAFATWLFSLGPFPTWFGEPIIYQAPYAWLMAVPGVSGLRVPARWWMLTVLCLSVVLGLLMSFALRGRSRRVVFATVVIVAAGLASDGWVSGLRAVDMPAPGPETRDLMGRVVLELPTGDLSQDAQAVYRAVTGNWVSVNGYSGYEPHHYDTLRLASQRADDSTLASLRELTELVVIVSSDAPQWMSVVAGLPGAVSAGRDSRAARYVLPRMRRATGAGVGAAIAIERVEASCGRDTIAALTDRNVESHWECGVQKGTESLVIDLGKGAQIGSVVHTLGRYGWHHPRTLIVETSLDRATWDAAWSGSILGKVFAATIEDWKTTDVVLTLEPRTARFVRLRQIGFDPGRVWSIAEIQVHEPHGLR